MRRKRRVEPLLDAGHQVNKSIKGRNRLRQSLYYGLNVKVSSAKAGVLIPDACPLYNENG